MEYRAKNHARLIGMAGFSEAQLNDHFTLYQGHVTNTNKLFDNLELMMNEGKAANPEFAQLRQRLGWEFNSMCLHEYYFENLGNKAPLETNSRLAMKLTESFGSVDAWEKDFRATGELRGTGWTVLYQDSANDRLINFWINEREVSHPAGCVPVLVMDVFEHAFMLDYGLKRADYIEAFFNNIDWKAVEDRSRH